jgi:hypothetical protein
MIELGIANDSTSMADGATTRSDSWPRAVFMVFYWMPRREQGSMQSLYGLHPEPIG